MSDCKVGPKATKTSWVVLMLNIQPELQAKQVSRVEKWQNSQKPLAKAALCSIHASVKVSHSCPMAGGWGQVTKEERSNKARVLL